jgi:hypothetical protein
VIADVTKVLILALVLVLSPVVAGVALANGGVVRPRRLLGGGASDSTAEGVALRATLGQPVVGVITGSGGDVTLRQGFQCDATPEYNVYLPLVIRD